MTRTDPTRVVRVSQTGQMTVPKELRDKHGIAGRARFRETENALVLEAIHIRTRSSAHARTTFEMGK